MSAFFPLQSIQVLWTRGATTCEDCGRVGQRDQGLVSEKDQYLLASFDLSALIYVFSAKNKKKPGFNFFFCCSNLHWL